MIRDELFKLQDLKYKEFHQRLMPTVNPDKVIGVRVPILKKFCDETEKREKERFIAELPHEYYEENNLHAMIIGECTDFEKAIILYEKFLPYIDNWATCDLLTTKNFNKHKNELRTYIFKWIKSDKTYTVRFSIKALMDLYLKNEFKEEYHGLVAGVTSDEYYINMMRAWYFSTALAERYTETLPYIESLRLDRWTHNKTIQKALESYRISDEQKIYLRKLKIK